MFSDLDEPDLGELETETMKQMNGQAALVEEADIISTEGAIPKGGITKIMVSSLPVPLEQIQSGKSVKRIPLKRLRNFIALATNAPILPKINQVCLLMPAIVLISN